MSGSFENRRKSSSVSKALMLATVFVLVIGVSVAGTLAWLSAQSETVTNTFTSAELFADPSAQFTLWEHQATDDDKDGRYTLTAEEVTVNTYDILPGINIPKDPTVDVVELEENAYLYIKVTDTLPEGLSYSIDAGNWEPLTGTADVWVYKGTHADDNVIKASGDSEKTFMVNILTQTADAVYGDYAITVPSGYTGAAAEGTLSFSAYMVQATGNGTNAAEAWANTYGSN